MRATILLLALALGIVFAASAFAGGSGPSASVYDKKGTAVQNTVGSAGGVSPGSASKSTPTKSGGSKSTPTTPGGSKSTPTTPGAQLPFTGLDLTFFVAAGIVLIAVGFSLHRVTRRRPTS